MMTIKTVSLVALCWLATFSTFAQNTQGPNIVGVGTTNYVPVFTGSRTIGNSKLFQSGGYFGIGTTTPQNVFNVVNGDNSVNTFGLEPLAIYGVLTNSTIDFSAAVIFRQLTA